MSVRCAGPGCDQLVHNSGDACSRCRAKEIQSSFVAPTEPLARSEGTPSLDELTGQSLRQLRRQLDKLDYQINAKDSYDAHHTAEATKLARAISGLLKEARALEKDARDEADELGHEGRIDLMVEWFGTLPPEYRARLVSRLETK